MAHRFGVSRQVIVTDVAILRAEGAQIMATPQGYTAISRAPALVERKLIAVKHTRAQTEDELMLMVQNGAYVLDVIVEHPIYGQITGNLFLRSEEDVKRFIEALNETGASLLSSLTGGVHLHTLAVPNELTYENVRLALASRGYLLEEHKSI